MKPDDPRSATYDLQRDVQHRPERPWPRPGEVTAIIATAVAPAALPPAPSIRAIVLNPSRYLDQKVTITGQFGGRICFGDLPDAPGKSRYDFVLRSADAAIWVINMRPQRGRKGKDFELSLDARIDTGRWLTVTGTVQAGARAAVARRRSRTASARQGADRNAAADDGADPRAGRAAAGSDLQRADPGRNRRLDEHDRADPVFARHRSSDAEGQHARALSRVADRRARRADDADRRSSRRSTPARTACSS